MKLQPIKIIKKIVAIGGGSIQKRETLAIDKEIVKLSGKKNPQFLFIPTASSDNEDYTKSMLEYYGKDLKCKTEVLFLIKEKPSYKEIKEKILNADIIYVGGGNTLKMMKLWRKLGVDKLLKQAWQKGTVMCGTSAGSICWFECGHSDSMSFYHPEQWNYICVKGLGFLKGIHCPHYDSHTLNVPRKKDFGNMMIKKGGTGIAIDDRCAMVFLDDEYYLVSSKKGANAFRVSVKKGNILSEEIKNSDKPYSY